MTDSGEHSSLLGNIIDYGRTNVYDTDSSGDNSVKLFTAVIYSVP